MDSDSRVLQSLRRISTSPYTQALSNVITVLFNGSSSATKGFLVCIGVFFNLPSLKVFHAERVSDNNTEGSCVIPVKASKVEELTLDLCRIRGSTICQLIQGTQAQQRLRYRNSGLGRMNFSLISSCVEESAAYDNSMARPQFDSNALFRWRIEITPWSCRSHISFLIIWRYKPVHKEPRAQEIKRNRSTFLSYGVWSTRIITARDYPERSHCLLFIDRTLIHKVDLWRVISIRPRFLIEFPW